MTTTLAPEDIARHMAALCSLPHKLPADTANWLQTACTEYMRGEGKRTLGDCLGLEGHGSDHTWLTKFKRAQRNNYLRQAQVHLVGDSELSDWVQAKLLVTAIFTFTKNIWPQWQNLETPPADAAEVNKLLFHATKLAGGDLPKTLRAVQTAARAVVQRPTEVTDLLGVATPVGCGTKLTTPFHKPER